MTVKQTGERFAPQFVSVKKTVIARQCTHWRSDPFPKLSISADLQLIEYRFPRRSAP